MLSFRNYIEYAEKSLYLAENEVEKSQNVDWLLISATILSWAAIESFINNMLDDFSSLPEGTFELHERAFLLEKRLQLIDKGNNIGKFVLEGTEYHRLEDKILFLIAKFSENIDQNIKGKTLWQDFQEFKEVRDSLIHPRRGKEISITIKSLQKYIETSKTIIQMVAEHVWKRPIEF